MNQATLFDQDVITKHTHIFDEANNRSGSKYRLIAVNKMYDWSFIVLDKNKQLRSVFLRKNNFKEDVIMPHIGNTFGINYHVVDNEYIHFQTHGETPWLDG